MNIEEHMKFGREFRIHLEKTLPEWRDKYLRYKLLKKLLKNIIAPANSLSPAVDAPPLRLPLPELQVWFVAILTEEVKKFNNFYVGKEEDLIIRFQVFSFFSYWNFLLLYVFFRRWSNVLIEIWMVPCLIEVLLNYDETCFGLNFGVGNQEQFDV